MVMRRQRADSPDIQLLGPFGEAAALPVFEHPSAPLSHGDSSGT
jgi:hypothetical protein